jgi:hypothetical protein
MDSSHFEGKEPLGHVAEKLAQGKIISAEVHGTELPGHISSGSDAARETAILLLVLGSLLGFLNLSPPQIILFLVILASSWAVWKFGRSAWLGWSRLERLHRVVHQEKWEIENNRDQEKFELKELYAAKGFQGKLLDDVVDVLMADGDRLLRVMVEEELGLTLESHEHPLKQACGALVGVLFASIITIGGYFIYPPFGLLAGGLITVTVASYISAYYEENRIIPAITWNIGLAVLAFAWVYFLTQFFFQN